MNTNGVPLWGVVAVIALWFLREIAGFVLKVKLEKYKDSVSRFFNRKLVFVFMDVAAMYGLVWLALALLNHDVPATKKDVLVGVGLTLGFVVMFFNFIDDLIIWIRRYREIKSGNGALVQQAALAKLQSAPLKSDSHREKRRV